MLTAIDPVQFVSTVRPLLEKQDMPGLVQLLQDRWSCDQIATLLMGENEDACKVAALCLSLVGKRCTIDKIAEKLKDADPMVNEMAEHALWSIWFRCGTPAANTELCRGTKALNARNFPLAMEHFDRAIAIDEDFAEAYNQRAIAHYLQEQYQESIADAMMAVEKMSCHFGALAGMGHCHLNLGDLPEAMKCYEQALLINPHLDCLNQSVTEIRSRLKDEGHS
jgi:tetratricopeptide (TPR) repeat protein